MLGVIYLWTIKNIYESVSAVCSKQEAINLPVYPRSSSPSLSSCLHLAISPSASPSCPISHFSVALITRVSACAHKDLPSVSNSSVLIGFFWGGGGWRQHCVIWCCLLNSKVEHISELMSLIQQF